MVLSTSVSERIVSVARGYVGQPFDYEKFNCIHFVLEVYRNVGIELLCIHANRHPPADFHLSVDEFNLMPVGHSVFLKRKNSRLSRVWTHVAIIVSQHELIHCTRNCGRGVVITGKDEFMEVYALVSK